MSPDNGHKFRNWTYDSKARPTVAHNSWTYLTNLPIKRHRDRLKLVSDLWTRFFRARLFLKSFWFIAYVDANVCTNTPNSREKKANYDTEWSKKKRNV